MFIDIVITEPLVSLYPKLLKLNTVFGFFKMHQYAAKNKHTHIILHKEMNPIIPIEILTLSTVTSHVN